MPKPRTTKAPEPPRRDETVLNGYHPETADFFTMGYDNRDPNLGASPKRMDLDYVGPERRSRRNKTHRSGYD